ncbi:uncharacterized protein LAESUDRAFT_749510 [Laetiporus sulphureus 93-53]|uniref:DUF6533 domain-containing protein n=1 Tax=Laetiporus sulphureus 93-53 TaxID=1314785 RepID=A0A165EIW1_9APHY|nr:uncharacterized protein LAESUDRAFT_749510 [Laetiporus sulphureus 93-53]KZT07142.1 hypothetical protein LAESUDRAFT_749510 [Laetiporus sulphureus 93-53]
MFSPFLPLKMPDMPSAALSITLEENFLELSLYTSAKVLVLYDYLLTIGDEYHYIWKARLSFPCVLFYACRYSAVLSCAVTVWSMMSLATWSTPASCIAIMILQMVCDTVLLTSAAVFAALRIYAIYRGSKSVFALVLLLSLVNPALTSYSFVVTRSHALLLPDSQATCWVTSSISGSIYDKWVIGGRAASVLADIIVFVLTWLETRQSRENSLENGLHNLMLINTAWSFAILSVTNVVSIAICHLDATSFSEPFAVWTAALTSMTLSRLMLNLRKAPANRNPTCPSSFTLFTMTLDAIDEHLANSDLDAPAASNVTSGLKTEDAEQGLALHDIPIAQP